MEPNNIENQIKQKLANQEIVPTAKAWDRLDVMLTVAEVKKSRKGSFWNPKYFAIAAVFVLIATLVFINFSDNNSTISNPESTVVVKQNETNKNQNATNPEMVIAPTKSVLVEKVVAVVGSYEKSSSNKNAKTPIINQKSEFIGISNQNPNQEITIRESNSNPTEKEIIAAKTYSISDADLLAEIDKASKNKIQKAVQIDARNLLFQVTSEINQEYRETNFQKLKRNFETVKVAISNRNIE